MWWRLRRAIRRRTKPIQEDTANKWHKRLSILYAICTWNAFGLVVFMFCTGRGNWAEYYGLKKKDERSVGEQWVDLLNLKNVNVIQVSGMSKVGEYHVSERANPSDTSKEEVSNETSAESTK